MSDCCSAGRIHPGPSRCPLCHHPGKPVPDQTPRALLRDGARQHLQDKPYVYCPNPGCDAVYFSSTGESVFRKAELRVRVGQKERTPPITVCYCFGHTKEDIGAEIQATGRSLVVERIRAEIKAGRCRCEVTNPRGTCCLGEVNEAVRAILASCGDAKG